MRRRVLFTATLSALIAAAMLTALASGPTTSAQPTSIEVGDIFFCDSSFQNGVCETTVTAGSTVTWQVSAGFHTVTQCDASFTTCPPAGGFDSGQLSSGGTFAQSFNTTGAVPYFCSNHPAQMRGRILVQAQVTATPAPTAPPGGSSSTPTPQQTTGAAGVPGATQAAAVVPAGGGDTGGATHWPLSAVLIALGAASLAAAGISALAFRRTRS